MRLLALLAFVGCASAQLYNKDSDIPKAEGFELVEGDMIVNRDANGKIRNAIRDSRMKWPKVNGKVVVPYEFDPSLPQNARSAVQQAIADYNAKTCIRFIPRTSEKNYASIFYGQGCYSYVGCVQQGKQQVSLGQGCEFKGTAVHELMHALGFYHEQNRPDRDQYITINRQNIVPGMENQFEVCQDCTTQNFPYEYASIMHYGSKAFTSNGKDTMVPKQQGATVVEPYGKPGLTALDAKKVNKLYGC